MPSSSYYIAIDLGAESGRVILGVLSDGHVQIEEVHRFANGAVRLCGTLRWDLLRIWEEIKVGLAKIAIRNLPIASISVDSWGVDYVLSRGKEPMLRPPYQYRDARTSRVYDAARTRVGEETIFRCTGTQFMPINTLYQLLADLNEDAELLRSADGFLMIGDWFHFLLSGRFVQEESNASTTQLWNPVERRWADELIHRFDLPRHLFPEIVPAGTVLGKLSPSVAEETGLSRDVSVIAGCTHDTGSAVAAVPADGENNDWAYLSSGTWSLIGVELRAPVVNEAVRQANFTNEAGFGGTTRFLRNVSGLWLLQECRRIWARTAEAIDYATLTELATAAQPLRSLIDPNATRFLSPADMTNEIAAVCMETGQPAPSTPGEIARTIFESLALLYREVLDKVEEIAERKIRVLYIVGGGSKNALLNQWTANATGRRVLAGPVEATALGNILIQAVVSGHLDGHKALRAAVRESYPLDAYETEEPETWKEAYQRFRTLFLR
jgi:rhamnulokinase